MHDRTLNHTLETEGRLGIDLARAGHGRGVVADEIRQGLAQIFDVDRARTQDFSGRRVVEQRQKQVFDRDELVPSLPRFDKGHM